MIKQEKFSNRQRQTSEQYRKILIRIRKAYDYVKSKQDDEQAVKKAEQRFKDSVIPECKNVGIDETFAWGLFYFGVDYIDKELKK